MWSDTAVTVACAKINEAIRQLEYAIKYHQEDSKEVDQSWVDKMNIKIHKLNEIGHGLKLLMTGLDT